MNLNSIYKENLYRFLTFSDGENHDVATDFYLRQIAGVASLAKNKEREVSIFHYSTS